MVRPAPVTPAAFDSIRLDDRDKDVLTDALAASSDWLAEIARTLLLPAHHPEAGRGDRRSTAVVYLACTSGTPFVYRCDGPAGLAAGERLPA